MKKILILYASIGLGHKVIAENIGYYLEQAGYQVELRDAQQVQGGFLARQGKRLYQWMVPQFPGVWDWLYNTKWFISLTLPYRTWVAGFNYKNVLSTFKNFNPDLVISTHATASAIVSYLKQKKLYNGKFGIAFSDFHLHRYWLFENADVYFANIEEQKQEMVGLGINANKIFVCGMLLKSTTPVNVEQTKNKFGILPGEKVVLVASGSQGFGLDESLIQEFVGKPNIKVIVVCGNNQEAFQKLSHKFFSTNITVLGYLPLDELYAIADVFITKPGGLSISEALNYRLPILISHMLPGQEQHNYGYLLKKSLVMPQSFNITTSALQEISTGAFKAGLQNNPEPELLFKGQTSLIQGVKLAVET